MKIAMLVVVALASQAAAQSVTTKIVFEHETPKLYVRVLDAPDVPLARISLRTPSRTQLPAERVVRFPDGDERVDLVVVMQDDDELAEVAAELNNLVDRLPADSTVTPLVHRDLQTGIEWAYEHLADRDAPLKLVLAIGDASGNRGAVRKLRWTAEQRDIEREAIVVAPSIDEDDPPPISYLLDKPKTVRVAATPAEVSRAIDLVLQQLARRRYVVFDASTLVTGDIAIQFGDVEREAYFQLPHLGDSMWEIVEALVGIAFLIACAVALVRALIAPVVRAVTGSGKMTGWRRQGSDDSCSRPRS